MLKKISAALLVASMLTAPALAATVIKTEKAPVAATSTTVAPAKTAAAPIKPAVANAKAQTVVVKKKITRHRHHSMRHHRAHSKMGALTTKKIVSVKKVQTKRVSAAKPASKMINNKG